MRRIPLLISVALAALLIVPGLALADSVPPPQPTLALPSIQVWTLVIGAFVPLAGYVINHHAPWLSEPAKAIALVVIAAVAGGLYQAINAGGVGLNTRTVTIIGTAVLGALLSHKIIWLPSGISTRLGGGTNAQS